MQVDVQDNGQTLIKIRRNDQVGRYAVASCDFNPGDAIFSESPFAFGPKADSPPICLGCCALVDGSQRCTSCAWPVCNLKCEAIPAHKNAECAIFSAAKVRFYPVANFEDPCPQYECITPLRVLLAKESNPDRWNDEVKEMESNNARRIDKPIWKFNQINIVNYLRGPCKLADRFDEELIHTVCGILESNAFEARSISEYPIRCLFPRLAILSHSCVSNIRHSIVCTGSGDGADFRVTVRAATKVLADEELFSSYTYSLWPTVTRREHLKEGKYFKCCCVRCSDPTEMETHMSSLKCNKCESGMMLSTNPLDTEANWVCFNCENIHENHTIRNIFATLQGAIDEADKYGTDMRVDLLETHLKNYSQILHPQNAYNCILRSSLIQMYGMMESQLRNNCSTALMEKKLEYCNQLLKVLDVIEPGYSRIRGITLYELYSTSALLMTKQQGSLTDAKVLQTKLQNLMKILEEATAILILEPESTFEGKIGLEASKALSYLKQHFEEYMDGKLPISHVILSN